MSDNKMLAGPRQGSLGQVTDASQWLDEHGDALYRYARSRVGQREVAEDLVQETFLAAVKTRESFQSESTVRTWLISILRRKIVDYYRNRSTAFDGESPSPRSGPAPTGPFTAKGKWRRVPDAWKTPPDILENQEFWTVFNACLSKLPATLASAFLLREMMGLKVEELGETLAISPGNVRVRLHRTRLLLRECLERNWFGENLPERKRLP